ncbi:hypothetical protein LJB98_05785 [Bacteroidales bacterium OttesenSCG-928-M11]|nr:hypothetical protein [Bacteroidales bacterium OttesenSCG-928-M11]
MWWIIGLVIIFVLVPLSMRISGEDSTYSVMLYNTQRVFTGSRTACENWIEDKIKAERKQLIDKMEKMCKEENLPAQDISMELRELESLYRNNCKIIRLN